MDKVIIYNPRHGAEINDIYAQKKWKHEVNTIKKYPLALGEYLLKKYGFLQEIQPKDLPQIKEQMKAKYECDFPGCDYIATTKKALRMHKLSAHKLTKEIEAELETVEEVEPTGEVEGLSKRVQTPEEIEGIPDTSKGEIEGWYGPGQEADKISSGMMRARTPGTPGTFSKN